MTVTQTGETYSMITHRGKGLLLAALTAGLAWLAWTLPPVGQAAGYHAFADQRMFFAIPRFWDVASNIGFLLTGLAGLRLVRRAGVRCFIDAHERTPYGVFFAGVTLTALGSAYYHLAPDNARLVWDRLPMTIAFMGLTAAVLMERIGPRAGRGLLFPLLSLGAGSVLYWRVTELAGQGDLRPYGFVQFYPLLLIPALMWLFPARYTHGAWLLAVIPVYGLAKCAEALDEKIYALGGVISGHTLKHVIAACGVWLVVEMLRRRIPRG